MKKEWVFSYGSNMDLEDLREWLIRHRFEEIKRLINQLRRTGVIAVIRGQRVVFNHISQGRGGGTCNIEKCEEENIYGVTYYIDEKFIEIFDKKEGYPVSHTRDLFQITLIKGNNNEEYVNAWVYYATPEKIDKTLKPTIKYKNVVIKGAKHWGLPPEYIKKLEKIPTLD